MAFAIKMLPDLVKTSAPVCRLLALRVDKLPQRDQLASVLGLHGHALGVLSQPLRGNASILEFA